MPSTRAILAIASLSCAAAVCAAPAALADVPLAHAQRVSFLPDPTLPYVDHVVVRKSERRLYLMDGNKVVRSFKIALGRDPVGPKERSGDFRTPEGWYRLERRNPRSEFFLSIEISYPNASDTHRAELHHWQPGGSIMIHGLPNRLTNLPSYYRHADWTDGCIAVSDADMLQIWLLTRNGMPIDIQP
jgi:murein L,D-transpeptidase YafK